MDIKNFSLMGGYGIKRSLNFEAGSVRLEIILNPHTFRHIVLGAGSSELVGWWEAWRSNPSLFKGKNDDCSFYARPA